MGNDFKIKFEYKGMGKAASATRQRVLQAQKTATQTGSSSTSERANKEFLSSLKTLNTSINKLIQSNKSLESSIKKANFGGGGGGEGGGGGDKSGGFGGMGASIPVLGAAIAAIGFTIQKVNQIGSAYMERTGQQFGSVGVAGFRGAHGLYNSAEIGQGMKGYSAGTGRFERKTAVNQSAIDIGTMFGVPIDETLKQAGIFSRTGGDYGKIANQALGGGIESELPMLLGGLSDTLEEAVKEGINASDMSKDIGKELINLTMKTPGKSVQAALGMMGSFGGVKKTLSAGKMGESLENMYAAQTTKDIMMQNLTGANKQIYIDQLASGGYITDKQKEKLLKLKGTSSYEDVQSAVGNVAAHTLFKKTAAETSTDKMMMETTRKIQKQYGSGAEGFQMFSTIADQLGWSDNQSQRMAKWQAAQGKPVAGAEKIGSNILEQGTKEVTDSAAGMSRARDVRREALMFKYGEKFAEASLQMEGKMLEIADKAAPAVVKGMGYVGDAAISLGNALESLSKKIEKSKNKNGDFSLWDFMTGN